MSSTTPKTKSKPKGQIKPKANHSLNFILTLTLRKCPLCYLSYIKGAEDDEAPHKIHLHASSKHELGKRGRERRNSNGQSINLEVENEIKLIRAKYKGRIIHVFLQTSVKNLVEGLTILNMHNSTDWRTKPVHESSSNHQSSTISASTVEL